MPLIYMTHSLLYLGYCICRKWEKLTRADHHTSHQHKPYLVTPEPSQKLDLTVTTNKIELIALICVYLRAWRDILLHNGRSWTNTSGDIQWRYEREKICAPHMMRLMSSLYSRVVHLDDLWKMSIKVVADDTDVFVLMLQLYKLRQLTCNLVMIGATQECNNQSNHQHPCWYCWESPDCSCSARFWHCFLLMGNREITVTKLLKSDKTVPISLATLKYKSQMSYLKLRNS